MTWETKSINTHTKAAIKKLEQNDAALDVALASPGKITCPIAGQVVKRKTFCLVKRKKHQICKISIMEIFAKIVSNINLNSPTVLLKNFVFDGWLGAPKCPSAGGWNKVLQIQMEISLWQQVKMASF